MSDDAGNTSGAPNAVTFRLYGLLAETFVHAGTGQTQSAIDLPATREPATGFPYIAGTSFKGALRDAARRRWGKTTENGKDIPTKEEREVFGETTANAGGLIVSDIRLLLLPVRSLSAAYRYVTCPQIIARFVADITRVGKAPGFAVGELLFVDDDKVLVSEGDGTLFLEELFFSQDAGKTDAIGKLAADAAKLASAPGFDKNFLAGKIAVVSDDMFAWFARSALPVRMRNALEEDTKTVKPGHLWSEEYLPPDTLMYALLGRRDGTGSGVDPLAKLEELLTEEKRYLQIGGNETVGQGWFHVSGAWQATP